MSFTLEFLSFKHSNIMICLIINCYCYSNSVIINYWDMCLLLVGDGIFYFIVIICLNMVCFMFRKKFILIYPTIIVIPNQSMLSRLTCLPNITTAHVWE